MKTITYLLILILTMITLSFIGLYNRINELKVPINSKYYELKPLGNLTITTYNDNGLTATTLHTCQGICAVSPNLINEGLILLGDWIVVDNKTYLVADKTSKTLKNRIDIWTVNDYYKKELPVFKVIR